MYDSCIDVTKNIELLIEQYSKSDKLKSTISGFLQLVQNEQISFICDFESHANSISKASNFLLDRIGENYGYPRPSFIIDNQITNANDNLYKILLKLWIAKIFYDGTTRGVNKALTDAFGQGFIYDLNNLSAEVWIFGASSDTIKSVIKSKTVPKVAGVRYIFFRSIIDKKKTFGFAGSGLNTFNQGSFANQFIGE